MTSEIPLNPCSVCNLYFDTKWKHHEHIHTIDHHKKISSLGRNTVVHNCACCQTGFNRVEDFNHHINTELHREKLTAKLERMKNYDAREAEKGRRNQDRAVEQQKKYDNRFQERRNFRDNRERRGMRGKNWKYQNQLQDVAQEYIDLHSGNSTEYNNNGSLPQNPANSWNRPFGYQFPYNQQYSHYPRQNQNTRWNRNQDYGKNSNQRQYCNDRWSNSHYHNQPSSQYEEGGGTSTSTVTALHSQPFPEDESQAQSNHSSSNRPTTYSGPFPSRAESFWSNSYSGSSASKPSTTITPSSSSSVTRSETKNSPPNSTDKCKSSTGSGKSSPTVPKKSIPSNGSASGCSTPITDKASDSSSKPVSKSSSKSSNSTKVKSESKATECRNVPGERTRRTTSESSTGSTKKRLRTQESRSDTPTISNLTINIKQEAVEPKSNQSTVSKLSEKPKLPPAAKRGNLKTLLSGRSNRQLQYELQNAVKEQRHKGRNYEIDASSALPDGCELESVASEDLDEVGQLLAGSQLEEQETEAALCESAADLADSEKRTSPDPRFAATMDSTRSQVEAQDYISSVISNENKGTSAASAADVPDPSPVVSKAKKRKQTYSTSTQGSDSAPSTTKKTKKKKVKAASATPPPSPAPSRKKAVKPKATKLKKTKVTKKRTTKSPVADASPSSTVAQTATASDCTLSTQRQGVEQEQETEKLKSEVGEKEHVISTLLEISVREEEIRRELPELENQHAVLVKEREVLDAKIAKLSAKISEISEEDGQLRKSRLEILRKANDNKSKAVTAVQVVQQQADTTCSTTSDLVSNSQYIGRFITSDAEEEKMAFSVLKERVRHLSQSSDGAVVDSDTTSNAGLNDIERRMKTIVESQVRRNARQLDNEMVYEGHTAAVMCLLVKGNSLFSSSGDKSIRRFDMETGACIATYHGHESNVKSFLVLSRHTDTLVLYSAGMDGFLLQFNVDNGERRDKCNLEHPILCMIEAYGNLYLGLQTGDLVSYNIADGCVSERYQTGSSGILAMCAAQEGARKLIICGSYDCTISVRDVKSGLLIRQMPGVTQFPRCMQVDESRPYLYISSGNLLQVYNYEKGVKISELTSGMGNIRSIIVGRHNETNLLLAASEDGTIAQYNLKSLQLTNVYNMQSILLAITFKKGKVFVGDQHGVIKSFTLTTNQIHCKIGSCNLPYGQPHQLMNHIFTSHLTDILSRHTCPWANCTSTEHHKSTEELRSHLYQAHIM